MRRLLIFYFIILIYLIIPISPGTDTADAADLVIKMRNGTYLFRCGAGAYQGKVRVIPLRDSRYRIFGVGFSGESYAESNLHAAQKGCGEDKLVNRQKTKNN